MLASVDESSLADDVLAWAAFLSRKLEAELAVVHVLDSGLWGAARSARSPDEMDRLEQTAESTTRQWLTARLEAAGLDAGQVEATVVFGEPKFEIVAAAKKVGADLLVVGSRGGAEFSAAHLGGVAASVLRGSDTPVFVVTGPAAATADPSADRAPRS
ncbi:universal stress protein [soil metagenome]